MSEFSLASTTVVKKKTQFSSLLLSNFMLFCSLILSHPLYFSYFIFFSPYLFKIFSFLSPLFVTTSLLVIAFLTVLRSEVVDGESDDGFGCLEELEAYKIVFETSTIVDIRENPDEVSGVEPVVGCLQGVELEEASVQRVETLTSGEFTETVRVNATVKILEEFLRQKDDGVVEILSSKSVEANNDKGSNPKTTMNADNGEEFEAKAMVNSPIVKANYGDNDMNFGNLGSMRKEKEWKRTLACKLFEERHNAVVAAATTENEGGEGMDLLWETYESSDTNKLKLKSFGSKKGKKGANYEEDDDDDYDNDSDGKLCCLQALKFSTGKMNLGMGMGRPNFVKISKAFKGFGWLHHVGSTKHGKKGQNSLAYQNPKTHQPSSLSSPFSIHDNSFPFNQISHQQLLLKLFHSNIFILCKMIKSLSFNSHLLVMLGNFGFQNSRRATSHGFLFCLKDQTITKMKKDARLRVDSELDGSLSLRAVPPTLIAAEKEEAKAVLTLFFKKQGLSNAVAARIINKSELFIDHLVSRLHSVHKSRYLVGRELTTLEIRDALIPYLESLLEEHGSMLADVVESFPHPPIKDKPITLVSPPDSAPDSKQVKAVSRVTETSPAGMLRPQVVYLMELGMDLEKIKLITRRFPAFAYYSLEGKIKPVVEFLLELGVPKSDIPIILGKRPQLCGISLSENLIPTMTFLEDLGVDKKQWAKVIYRFPALLTYSRQKFKTTVDFLYEMGLSSENVGKVLTRCPTIISYSVEDKLHPTAKYFRSLGADVSLLLLRCPQTFGLSIEANLKPVTQFFIERGYTLEEIGTMISRYGALYTFSLADNLIPKWDFFLTMDYSKSELVKFPQYFGYSLEERIKPRIALVKKAGVRLLLNQILSLSSRNFENALEKKMQQQLQLTDQV